MFEDMGHRDAARLDEMSIAFEPWVRQRMESAQYFAWLAMDDQAIIGGAGLWLMDWLPHLIGRGQQRGNIVNVYVAPEFRRRGIARALTQAALDLAEARGIDCVILHASDAGRALYESMGFRATNEMRRLLP